MEPITTLAATAISILVPYAAKGAEEFVKAAGKDAYEKAKKLFNYLKEKFSGDEEAASTLTNFEKKPERHGVALEGILQDKLENDESFAAELSKQLKDIGPYIEVIQKMKKGEDVAGLRAEEMSSGTARVQQDIEEAKRVDGAVIKKIG